MEIETLFTTTKWEIFKFLSKRPYSPLELANLTNTTMANISQQLRLLEAAGLVKADREKKIKGVKKKRRIIYSIAKDFSFIISISKSLAEKKELVLDNTSRFIFNSFIVDDPIIKKLLFKIAIKLDSELNKNEIDSIYYNITNNELFIITSNKKIEQKLSEEKKSRIIKLKTLDKLGEGWQGGVRLF